MDLVILNENSRLPSGVGHAGGELIVCIASDIVLDVVDDLPFLVVDEEGGAVIEVVVLDGVDDVAVLVVNEGGRVVVVVPVIVLAEVVVL